MKYYTIAYRTRNEFLMYAVNRQKLDKESQLWQSLDEMTSMKILSRIEGDSDRTKNALEGLQKLVKEQIEDRIPTAEEDKPQHKSISATKITEMLDKQTERPRLHQLLDIKQLAEMSNSYECHFIANMYPKTRIRVHIPMNMYSKTGIRVHISASC